MSDSNLGKKLVEEKHLCYFLDAYRTVTGTTLTLLWGGSSRGTAQLICFSHFCFVQLRVALHCGSSPLAERGHEGLA